MAWFCDDKAVTIAARIREAAEHYAQKFGQRPDLCLISQQDYAALSGGFEWGAADRAAIELRAVQYVRPNNYFVGRKEATEAA